MGIFQFTLALGALQRIGSRSLTGEAPRNPRPGSQVSSNLRQYWIEMKAGSGNVVQRHHQHQPRRRCRTESNLQRIPSSLESARATTLHVMQTSGGRAWVPTYILFHSGFQTSSVRGVSIQAARDLRPTDSRAGGLAGPVHDKRQATDPRLPERPGLGSRLTRPRSGKEARDTAEASPVNRGKRDAHGKDMLLSYRVHHRACRCAELGGGLCRRQ